MRREGEGPQAERRPLGRSAHGDDHESSKPQWGLTVGEAIDGGSATFVAEAATDDGTALDLKVTMPDGLKGNGSLDHELENAPAR